MRGLAATLVMLVAAAEKRPAFHLDRPSFEFGSVVFGQLVSHRFELQNRGDAPLRITEVNAPCKCFRASYDKEIAPGQAGKLQVEIDTSELSGPVFLSASVRTNDPARPRALLRISGEVRGPVVLLPRDHVDLTTVAGEDQEQPVVLEINRKAPLKATKVESTSKVFVPRLETEAAGKRYRVVVKAKGNQPLGVHRGTVRILTDDAERPVIPLECSLLVVSGVVAEPETLFVPALDQDQARKGGKTAKVRIKHVRGRPFEVVRIRSDLPFVRATFRRLDAQSHEVSIELQPNEVLRPGRTVGSLHVTTNLPDGQDLKVPVWLDVH